MLRDSGFRYVLYMQFLTGNQVEMRLCASLRQLRYLEGCTVRKGNPCSKSMLRLQSTFSMKELSLREPIWPSA